MHQTNSEQIVKQLFDEHFHKLVLSSLRFVNDYSQAEDIVQDVFVKVWQNIDQVRHVEDLKGYLFKAVRNSSMNFLRHIKIRQKFVAESEVISSSAEKSQEEIITTEETNTRIHKAVNKLPDNWKEAFVFSKYDKLKYHEIALKMDISQKTVEKYISKALQFLQKELKDILVTIILTFGFLSNNNF
jgi:RNA polymerase sigma-70 factor (ECF subfamily)